MPYLNKLLLITTVIFNNKWETIKKWGMSPKVAYNVHRVCWLLQMSLEGSLPIMAEGRYAVGSKQMQHSSGHKCKATPALLRRLSLDCSAGWCTNMQRAVCFWNCHAVAGDFKPLCARYSLSSVFCKCRYWILKADRD